MPVVIRRTQTLTDRIAELTLLAKNIGADQITRAKIAAHAVGSQEIGTILPTEAVGERALGSEVLTRRKLSYMTQIGSVRVGSTRYYSFPRTFAATPYVVLNPLGSVDLPSGSVAYTQVMTAVSGSFSAKGTPTGYCMYIAYGSA